MWEMSLVVTVMFNLLGRDIGGRKGGRERQREREKSKAETSKQKPVFNVIHNQIYNLSVYFSWFLEYLETRGGNEEMRF